LPGLLDECISISGEMGGMHPVDRLRQRWRAKFRSMEKVKESFLVSVAKDARSRTAGLALRPFW
jgi:hypothetical protein